jgi:hypothetical protein
VRALHKADSLESLDFKLFLRLSFAIGVILSPLITGVLENDLRINLIDRGSPHVVVRDPILDDIQLGKIHHRYITPSKRDLLLILSHDILCLLSKIMDLLLRQ